MFEEPGASHADVEVERISNGYVIGTRRGREHVKTFNGLVSALEKIFGDNLILDREYANYNNNK